jgi:hypothetical protein
VNDDPDDLPESIDLETVRRDKPVVYAGRVQKVGFREGVLVAAALFVILAGAGIVAIGPAGPHPSASPSNAAVALPLPTSAPSPPPTTSPSPTPAGPTPAATPSVRCGTGPTRTPPFVNLLVPGGNVVGELAAPDWLDGPATFSGPQAGVYASVTLGQQLVLSVNFAACALEWRVTLDGEVVLEQSNPAMDPAYARQAYFVLPGRVSKRAQTLQLDLHYPDGWASSAWWLTVESWPALGAYAIVGAEQWYAAPGCGFSVELVSGATGIEDCTTILPDDIPTAYVPAGSEVVFRVTEAIFIPASDGAVACGHVKGSPPAFAPDPTCELITNVDSTLGDFHVFAPARASIHVIEITGCATFNGGQACGPWFVRLDSVHPEPTPGGIVD